MATVLVTGGAGYIGSHTAGHLLAAGHRVVVYDDLSTGNREAVPHGCVTVWADLADSETLRATLREYEPDAVVHFAAAMEAGLSMTDPRRFWTKNVRNSIELTGALLDTRPIPVVFSSTSAVYGQPEIMPIPEQTPKQPESVYGYTKLVVENLLDHYWTAYRLPSVALRYFNACGARPDGGNGPAYREPTQLMPIAMLTALGKRERMEVFGTDYPTRDGSCIRDYIHVEDLASAHLAALDLLLAEPVHRAYNVGLGRGFTVLEVLDSVRRVTGVDIPVRLTDRRPGDPVEVVADPSRIMADLGWKPEWTDLDAIVETAWRWHSTHPDGFAG